MARNRPGHRAKGRIQTAAGAVTAPAHLMARRAAPAGAFGRPGVPFLRAVATRGSVAAQLPQARCSGALGGAKRGRESGGALLKSAAEKIEGAPFRVLPLLLNKGRPVWVGQVLFLPSAPALVGSGDRQVCSIAGSS